MGQDPDAQYESLQYGQDMSGYSPCNRHVGGFKLFKHVQTIPATFAPTRRPRTFLNVPDLVRISAGSTSLTLTPATWPCWGLSGRGLGFPGNSKSPEAVTASAGLGSWASRRHLGALWLPPRSTPATLLPCAKICGQIAAQWKIVVGHA